MSVQPERPWRVLIIEDNDADAMLLKLAWEQCTVVQAELSFLEDSRDAIKFLRGAEPYVRPTAPPELILLDYKMPVDGGIALIEIKGDPDFLHIPVVVLTGSDNPRDFLDSYRRGANCCYKKPFGLNAHMKLVCEIAEHWFHKVTLPPVINL